jgi:hypothetical protein
MRDKFLHYVHDRLGLRQCGYVTITGIDRFRCCTFVEGHEGEHEDCYSGPQDHSRYWYNRLHEYPEA